MLQYNSAFIPFGRQRLLLLSFIQTIYRSSTFSYAWWVRVALVLPICILLWLGVYWALSESMS